MGVLTVLHEIEVKPLNTATSVYFPNTMVIPAGAAVLFKPESMRRQRLSFVMPGRGVKTYPVREHSRARWATIPSTWLRAVSAKPGDAIVVYKDATQPETLLLEFKRMMPL